MSDIELVIKIPDHLYKLLKEFPSDSKEASIENVLMIAVEHSTPLPKGHGRLIDADALYDQYRYADYDFDKTMEYAPTIIEADNEVEE